ncbi:hypothetical protein [Mycolicibacterium moriokaense]|uniref:Uncharacterized protein n=1 Tax=Mycolicibacterium moriokaense TaxID=39691 RepID=A0A318HPH9_9MYCO|nr:hypothetical protein [Mycolicibacterium moriokaense]PXX08824.1 hypothetical protein C8E89_107129 [Mycolicibacterium moriokaense]
MKTKITHVTPWLAAAAIGGAIALAPIASAASHPAPAPSAVASPSAVGNAGTDPSTPYGTDPVSPDIFGYHTWLGDDKDVPF